MKTVHAKPIVDIPLSTCCKKKKLCRYYGVRFMREILTFHSVNLLSSNMLSLTIPFDSIGFNENKINQNEKNI